MKFSEIKKKIKKDPPGSVWIFIHRKIGLVFTWVFVNAFPKVKPNQITISMLFFNITAAVILYVAITTESILLMLIAFLIFAFSLTLDCVDGNLARIYSMQSYKGVYLDRIVHNISHPFLILAIGYGVSTYTQNYTVLLFYITAAIFSEFTPLEMARKDVKVSFINQLLLKKSYNFEAKIHTSSFASNTDNKKIESKFSKLFNIIIQLLKIVFSYETMILLLIVVFIIGDYLFIYNVYIASFSTVFFIKGFYGNDLEAFFEKLNMLNN